MSLNSFIEYLVKERNFSNNTIIAYKNDLDVFQNFCLKEFNHENLNKSIYVGGYLYLNYSYHIVSYIITINYSSSIKHTFDFLSNTSISVI